MIGVYLKYVFAVFTPFNPAIFNLFNLLAHWEGTKFIILTTDKAFHAAMWWLPSPIGPTNKLPPPKFPQHTYEPLTMAQGLKMAILIYGIVILLLYTSLSVEKSSIKILFFMNEWRAPETEKF